MLNKEEKRELSNYDLVFRMAVRTAYTHNISIVSASDAFGVLREYQNNKETSRYDPFSLDGQCKIMFQSRDRKVNVQKCIPMNIFNGKIDNDRASIKLVCEKLDNMVREYNVLLEK